MKQQYETCSIEEYLEGEKNRLREAELCVGGIYSTMFRMGRDTGLAVRFNAKLIDLWDASADARLLQFALVDDDFRPSGKASKANIHDGIMGFDGLQPMVARFADNRDLALQAGFFQDYEQLRDVDAELYEMIDAELVLVRPKYQQL